MERDYLLPVEKYGTLEQAELAWMHAFRTRWVEDVRGRSLAEVIECCDWFTDLVVRHPHRLAEDEPIIEELEDIIETEQNRILNEAKRDNQVAFFKPSYHQAQILNAWHPECEAQSPATFEPRDGFSPTASDGYRSVGDFSAIRVGKSYGTILDVLLWTLPNDPEWPIFEPMVDQFGREYQVKVRPKFDYWRKTGRMIYDPSEPPKPDAIIWHGCVNETHWRDKVEPMYRLFMPDKWVARRGKDRVWMLADKYFETKWGARVTAKLYGAEMQDWGGKEMFMIVVDEGIPRDKLREAVYRTFYFRWAYTPREPANEAEKAQLAHEAYHRKFPLVGATKFIICPMRDVPDHIMPKEQRDERIRIAEKIGGEELVAINGGFARSSPVVFSNYKPERHVLPFGGDVVLRAIKAESTKHELERWPWLTRFIGANIIRGFDEGTSHPTTCLWGCLLQTGERVAFKELQAAGLSVTERVQKIIAMSGNERMLINRETGVLTPEQHDVAITSAQELMADQQRERDTGLKVVRYKEIFKGMHIRKTFADSKIFRRDPNYLRDNWVENYARAGIRFERAVAWPPEQRCDYANDLFLPDHTRQHLNVEQVGMDHPEGHRVYLTNDLEILKERMENYLQGTLISGPNRGDFTGKPSTKGDDLVDAFTYFACAQIRWRDLSAQYQEEAVPMSYSTGGVTGY